MKVLNLVANFVFGMGLVSMSIVGAQPTAPTPPPPSSASTPPPPGAPSATPTSPPPIPGAAKPSTMPTPPAAVTQPKIKELVPRGLDTTDVGDQGNWMLKRVWYEQAEDVFGKVLQDLDSIIQQQIGLFKSITAAEKKSESVFKKANSLEVDDVSQQVDYLLKKIDEEPKEEATVVRETRELIVENKSELEGLAKDIKKYQDIEASSNDVVNQIISQVNKARKYQKDGWSDFKNIGETLNDDKAKELYYKLEGYSQTMQNINSYLSGSLSSYLNTIASSQTSVANDVVAAVAALDKKDLNLAKLEEVFKNAQKYLEEEMEAAKKVAAKKAKQKHKDKDEGWFSSIINWFKSWF